MLITDNDTLLAFCASQITSPILFVDTEFLRERTYYPLLCLIQIAGVEGEAAAIDTLSEGLDLRPLFDLINDPSRLKVMHAARQDMELFLNYTGQLPSPLCDTQIAAMILGLGEQMGYDALVRHFLGMHVCKAQQFTDWSRRPLLPQQLEYALDDVRHLRDCYPLMVERLKQLGRAEWVAEEVAYLLEPSLYSTEPQDAWLRIRKRDTKPGYLARLQALADWREREAQRCNIPRNAVIHDDSLQEIALTNPKHSEAMQKVRGIPRKPERIQALLQALEQANALPPEACPVVERKAAVSREDDILRDALKLLLKCRAKEYNVTPGLLCDTEGLQQLIEGEGASPALHGWRREMFGNDALAMLAGTLTVQITKGQVFCNIDAK
jgi:ribonuclease D